MNVLSKVLVGLLTIVVCSGANASVLDSGLTNGFNKSYSASWFNVGILENISSNIRDLLSGGKNKGYTKPSNAVPELDAATAPLAALLLSGLLAAGAERRRRKNK